MKRADDRVGHSDSFRKKVIVLSDLDGTLLSYPGYSFEAAGPALRLLAEKKIPLIVCSSKTRREIEYYRKRMHNSDPFVAENGGGIFIPKGYFKRGDPSAESPVEDEGQYELIRLGVAYDVLREALQGLRRQGFAVRGFGDMTAEEIAQATGLSASEAELARHREFDEPFFFERSGEERERLLDRIREKGFKTTEGTLLHLLGDSDKGKAALILARLYKKEYGAITSIGLGDSHNDLPMLEQVDYPVIVRKHDGTYDSRVDLPNLIRADGIGPEGWNRVVTELMARLAP